MVEALIIILIIGFFSVLFFVIDTNAKNDNKKMEKIEGETDELYLLRNHLNNDEFMIDCILDVQNKFPNEKIISTINTHFLLFRSLYDNVSSYDKTTKYGFYPITQDLFDDEECPYPTINSFIYATYLLTKKIYASHDIPKPISFFHHIQLYGKDVYVQYNLYCHKFEEKKVVYNEGKYERFYIYNPFL